MSKFYATFLTVNRLSNITFSSTAESNFQSLWLYFGRYTSHLSLFPTVTESTNSTMDCISGKFRIPTNSPQILLYVIWNFHRFVKKLKLPYATLKLC